MKLFASIAAAALLFSASLAAAQAQRAAACEDAALAKQETVAALRDLQGNVLVSDKDGVVSATNGQRVANRSRVTTTSKAGVVVVFDCGCNVQLKENERLDLDIPRGCGALLASVQPVPVGVALGAVPVAPVAPAVVTTPGVVAVGGVGATGYALYRRNRNVSPN